MTTDASSIGRVTTVMEPKIDDSFSTVEVVRMGVGVVLT
jgi:hypothetical protein